MRRRSATFRDPSAAASHAPPAAGRAPRRRGRRAALTVFAVLMALLVVSAASWVVPWGSHAGWRAVGSAETVAALAEFGRVEVLDRSPEGDMKAQNDRAVAVRLDSGGTVIVSAFEYRSQTERVVRSWIFSPERNSVRWDDPQRWVPQEQRGWLLPGGSRLVGFMCQSRVCDRWLLWWPRGADVVLIDLRGPRVGDPQHATDRLRPIWEAID